jgi:hypothetical protein
MPIRDIAAMNRSLDNDYGSTRGPNAPDSHFVSLWVDDPMLGGEECDGPGYARVELDQDTGWQAADDGYKDLVTGVQFAAPSGAWPQCTHWALMDDTDPDQMWDCGPLTSPLNISSSSPTGPLVTFAIYYDDAVLEAP